jgi:GT2 family glycosyltransferase
VFDAHPEVSAVTGRTVPDGSPTAIQHLFEEFGSFNRGTERRVWHYPEATDATPLPPSLIALGVAAESPAIFPYSAVFGSGNNMALRTAALERVGAFDEALGAGVPAGGGEDLDMFVRLMLAGLVLVYEPAAVVRHTHREDAQTLAAQVRSYGSGLSAMITKHLLLDRPSRIRILRRAVPGLRHLFSARSDKNARKSAQYPRHLTRLELLGIASGPSRYLRGRRALLRDRPIDGSEATTAADAATGVDERAVA